MAQAPAGCLALAVALGALLHGGLGQAPRESHLAAGSSGHPRTKRCSCNSWLDTECIYFCHLDIIWVNTPGHTAPYGLGRAPRRRKRSLNRCECLHSKDSICTTFCQAKPWSVRNLKLPVSAGELGDNPHSSDTKHPQSDLLKALRDLAVSNSQLSRRHYSTQKDGQQVVLPWKKSIWKKKR